jgi:RNA polymerase sigma factor (sigma-70 family)
MSDVHLIENSAMVRSSTAKDLEEPRGRELLACISARDRSAMGEFYVSYFARLVNFFAFLTAGHDLVEELISDTMLKVWRESATIRKTALVSVWIMNIAYSHGRDRIAEGAVGRRQARPSVVHTDYDAPSFTPFARSSRMHDVVVELAVEERAVVHLAYAGGFSRQDIADIMNLSCESIEVLMTNASRRLRLSGSGSM